MSKLETHPDIIQADIVKAAAGSAYARNQLRTIYGSLLPVAAPVVLDRNGRVHRASMFKDAPIQWGEVWDNDQEDYTETRLSVATPTANFGITQSLVEEGWVADTDRTLPDGHLECTELWIPKGRIPGATKGIYDVGVRGVAVAKEHFSVMPLPVSIRRQDVMHRWDEERQNQFDRTVSDILALIQTTGYAALSQQLDYLTEHRLGEKLAAHRPTTLQEQMEQFSQDHLVT